MHRFSSLACLGLVTTALLAACTTTPPPAQRTPPTTITSPPGGYGGLSRAQMEAAGNACEKAVAAAVKNRYPQPGSIMMMPDRERVYQQSVTQTGVNGEGTFEPDASDSAMSFRYTCLYNTHSNRVDDVQMRF
ncbi:short-chain fatty acid transporter [Cupriavidus campinensis]